MTPFPTSSPAPTRVAEPRPGSWTAGAGGPATVQSSTSRPSASAATGSRPRSTPSTSNRRPPRPTPRRCPSARRRGAAMPARTEVDARQALAERLIDATTHALETLSVYLGLELGLYQALTKLGTASEAEVVAESGVAARYAREWLEQQTTGGYLACNDPARPPEERRYRLPSGHAEVLLDADSPYHAGPLAVILAGIAGVLPQLLEAYRTGGGVPYAAYGQELRRGIAAL